MRLEVVNPELARDYLKRAEIRLKLLKELFTEEDYADIIRLSQEIVELC